LLPHLLSINSPSLNIQLLHSIKYIQL
jgi:hypothetical protein